MWKDSVVQDVRKAGEKKYFVEKLAPATRSRLINPSFDFESA